MCGKYNKNSRTLASPIPSLVVTYTRDIGLESTRTLIRAVEPSTGAPEAEGPLSKRGQSVAIVKLKGSQSEDISP